MVANTFSKAFHVCLGLHKVVMIAGTYISQEIFAIDVLTALKSSLEQRRKHFLDCHGPGFRQAIPKYKIQLQVDSQTAC